MSNMELAQYIAAYLRRNGIAIPSAGIVHSAIESYYTSLLGGRTQTGWQPIETAPKDGAVVIGFDPTRESFDSWDLGYVEFMRWLDGAWLDPATYTMRPTHWMPLPDPPSAASRTAPAATNLVIDTETDTLYSEIRRTEIDGDIWVYLAWANTEVIVRSVKLDLFNRIFKKA